MAILNPTFVTVDAILTTKGRGIARVIPGMSPSLRGYGRHGPRQVGRLCRVHA